MTQKRNENDQICWLSHAVQFCTLISGICGQCQINVSNQLWWKHICQINRLASLHSHCTIVQKWLWNFWHVGKTCPQQPPRNVIPSVAPIYKAPFCGCVTIAVYCKVDVFVVVFEQCEMWPKENVLLKVSLDVSHAIGHSRNRTWFLNLIQIFFFCFRPLWLFYFASLIPVNLFLSP